MTAALIIVTAGDAGYFHLLRGCVASIRDKPQGRDVPMGVLDLGLAEDQVAWLRGLGIATVKPGWDLDLRRREPFPEHYKALTARPFISRYFPGYATYMWLDADAWVQDWAAIELYRQAAADGSLACTPEMDRSYRNFFHAWQEFHDVIHDSYAQAYGRDVADEMVRHPLVNSGAFALRPGAPHWDIWARLMEEGLRRSDNFLTEQDAFNLSIYKHGVRTHFLPAWCNWTVHHSFPVWDTARECFVEPYLPHLKLGILHLTIYTKTRETLAIRQLGGPADGEVRPMKVRYL